MTTTSTLRSIMVLPPWRMIAKDSRRAPIPNRSGATSPSRPWRVGFGTGCVYATAAAPSARCALRSGHIRRGSWREHASLGRAALDENPDAILEALIGALRDGASPVDVARAIAFAAALRIAYFGTSNDHSDWESAHHAFSYANA